MLVHNVGINRAVLFLPLLLLPVIPVGALNANELTDDMIEVREDILELEAKRDIFEQNIEDAERNYKNFVRIEADKKNVYDDNPNEDTRKVWDDAKKDTSEAFKDLVTAQREFDELVRDLDNLRLKLVGLEKNFDDLRRLQEISRTDDKTKSIGISLSQSCITLLQSDMRTDCPTYEDLLQLDSSVQEWSGEFVTQDGWTFRDEPNLQNSWRLYDHEDEFRVFIDPPKGMHDKIKMITIEPSLEVYVLTVDSTVYNYTRVIYHDRYVDKCRDATITAEKWRELSVDTIYFMRNGCDLTFTSFNHIEFVPIKLTKHDITTTQKWQDDQRMQHILEHCIYKYKACT